MKQTTRESACIKAATHWSKQFPLSAVNEQSLVFTQSKKFKQLFTKPTQVHNRLPHFFQGGDGGGGGDGAEIKH